MTGFALFLSQGIFCFMFDSLNSDRIENFFAEITQDYQKKKGISVFRSIGSASE